METILKELLESLDLDFEFDLFQDPEELERIAKEQRREYMREYQKKNRTKCNEYQRKWNAKNKDKVKAIQKKYWLKKAIEKTKGVEVIVG